MLLLSYSDIYSFFFFNTPCYIHNELLGISKLPSKISYCSEKGRLVFSSCAGLKWESFADAGGGAGRFKVSVEHETLILLR